MILLSSVASVAHAAQGNAVEWRGDAGLTPADKTAIIRLADQMGIQDPRRASAVTVGRGRRVVIVESKVFIDGHRRSWRELWVCRADWPCAFGQKPRADRWYSDDRLRERENWRIRDRDWHIDIDLQLGIPYGDAQQVVVAIHRGELVNRLRRSLGPIKLNPVMPTVNANNITRITKGGSDDHEYDVWIGGGGVGGGRRLHVRIREGKVELHGLAVWNARFEGPTYPTDQLLILVSGVSAPG
jgi:hypothetical protein